MLDLSLLSPEGRITLALKFLSDHNMMGLTEAVTISRDNFDIWIIDNGLADDPGTDDTKELVFKGFVHQRTGARNALNRWAKKIQESRGFSIDPIKTDRYNYMVMPWADSAVASASDIGNRVELFTANKVKGVKGALAVASQQGIGHADSDALILMISQLEGHSIVMHRNIMAETIKYNHAVDMVKLAVSQASDRVALPEVTEDSAA